MQSGRRIKIENNPALTGMASMIPNVEYSAKWKMKLSLLWPWDCTLKKKHPLLVFVQGSAWTSPNIYMEIPQLSDLARKGYVVATVEHRSSLDHHAWPAYLQDVKCAIRFLRAHHEEYGIDPERVGIWGTSSGGNTALLVGLTADSPEFPKEEYPEYSDAVDYVVNCFGPSDIESLTKNEELAKHSRQLFEGLVGEREPQEVIREMSPILRVKDGEKYPPFLHLHGDRDEVVAFEQSERMHERLLEAGASSTLVEISGAPHEGDFWSRECLLIIEEFIGENS